MDFAEAEARLRAHRNIIAILVARAGMTNTIGELAELASAIDAEHEGDDITPILRAAAWRDEMLAVTRLASEHERPRRGWRGLFPRRRP